MSSLTSGETPLPFQPLRTYVYNAKKIYSIPTSKLQLVGTLLLYHVLPVSYSAVMVVVDNSLTIHIHRVYYKYSSKQISMDIFQKEQAEWERKHPGRDFDAHINDLIDEAKE